MKRALSSKIPIIKLYRDIIVVVQGDLTDRAIEILQQEVTQAIERYDALGLVIDVTGVDLMDSFISRAIYDTASIARFMGVDTLVCGIHPDIAITLVEMNLHIGNIRTELNLEKALEVLKRKRKRRLTRSAFDDDWDQDDFDLDDDRRELEDWNEHQELLGEIDHGDSFGNPSRKRGSS